MSKRKLILPAFFLALLVGASFFIKNGQSLQGRLGDRLAWTALGNIDIYDPNAGGFNWDMSADYAGGQVNVIWSENYSTPSGKEEVYYKQYDIATGAWTQLGGALNPNLTATYGMVQSATLNATPYAGWIERSALSGTIFYSQYWDGAAWQSLPDFTSFSCTPVDSQFVDFKADATNVYLATQCATALNVYYYDGAAWVQVGGNIENGHASGAGYTLSGFAPVLSFDPQNNMPYIAWVETLDTAHGGTGLANLYVKYWDGATWQALGSSLNIDVTNGSIVTAPVMTVTQGIPYVSWLESKVLYVAYWDGNAGNWFELGGGVSTSTIVPDANTPQQGIAMAKGKPYVSFVSNNDIYVLMWDGSTWVSYNQAGAALNYDTAQGTKETGITTVNGRLFLGWNESSVKQNTNQWDLVFKMK